MPNISIISKESHQVLENVNSSQVGLNENSVVVVQVSMDDVASITRDNNDAVINLRNGEVVIIKNYFAPEFADNSLVFQEQDGQLHWVKFTNDDGTIAETILYYPIQEIESLLYSDNFIAGFVPIAALGGAVAAVAGAAAGGSKGGGDNGGVTPQPTPKPNTPQTAAKVTDTKEPHVGTVPDGGSTNDKKPVLSGTGAVPGAIIKIYNGDQVIGETTVQPDGTWSFTPTQELNDGAHNLTYTQTVDGQESDKSPSTKIIVDTVAELTIVDPKDTNNPQPYIGGKTEPGSKVHVKLLDASNNVVDEGEAIVAEDNWYYIPSKPLPEGNYKIQADAEDPAGNKISKESATEFKIDYSLPDHITVTVDPVTAPTNDKNPTLTGTTRPGSLVKVKLVDKNGRVVEEGPATVKADGTWEYKTQNTLIDGKYSASAEAVDVTTFETGKSKSESFVVDATAPDLSIDPLADTNDTTPKFSGKTEPGAKVTVQVLDKDGQPIGEPANAKVDEFGNWSYEPTTPLPPGEYKVKATAEDDAHNKTEKVSEGSFKIDTTVQPEIAVTIDNSDVHLTNDNTPTLTGKTEAGSEVTVKIYDKDGKNVIHEGKATVTGDSWTYTPPADKFLSDGAYKAIAEATIADPARKGVSAPKDFTVDTQPPFLTIDDVANTKDTTPLVTGKTEPGATVKVEFIGADGKPVGEPQAATVDKDGNWTFKPTTPLPPGDYKVKATATDKANNSEVKIADKPFKIDTTLPDNLNVSVDALPQTNKKKPEFTGKNDANTTSVTVSVLDKDGKVVATGEAKVNGTTWSYTPSEDLVDGTYHIEAHAKGPNNSEGKSKPVDVVVDTVPPKISIDDLPNTNKSQPQIHGKTEPGSLVKVDVLDENNVSKSKGLADVDKDGEWIYTPNKPLDDGTYKVNAEAVDDANNIGKAESKNFIIDKTLPDSIEISVDPINHTNDTTPEFKGKTTAGTTAVKVHVLGDDGKVIFEGDATVNGTSWSYTPTEAQKLQDGTYKVYADATGANNITGKSKEKSFTVDTVPPQVKIDPIKDTNDQTPTIKGTLNEPSAKVVVQFLDKDNKVVQAGDATVDPKTGNWTYTPTEKLPLGEYKVKAIATDLANNKGEDVTATAFKIDPEVPDQITVSINDIPVTNKEQPEITGKNSLGSKVTVTLKNDKGVAIETGEATVTADGWKYTPQAKLAEGKYQVVAKAEIGANSAESKVAEFTVDLTPPHLTIDDLNNTNLPKPPISGTTDDPKSEVTVKIFDKDGKEVDGGKVKPDSNGKWIFTPSNDLPPGEYTIKAESEDDAGNKAKVEQKTITVDPVVPDQITVSVDAITLTNKAQPEITGKNTAGSKVKVILQDALGRPIETGEATVTAGTWKYTPKNTLVDGKYHVVAEAELGTKKAISKVEEFTVDLTPPRLTIDDLGHTKDTKPKVTGTTDDPKSDVTVKIFDKDGKEVDAGTVKPDEHGNWSFTPSKELPAGDYTIKAESKDPAGNETKVESKQFTVDPTALDKLKVSIDELTLTNNNKPPIKGKTEAGTAVEVTIYDKAGKVVETGKATVTGETWTYTPAKALVDGDYKVFANAATTTAPIRTGKSAAEDFTVDTVPPKVTIDDIPGINNNLHTFTGTTEPGAKVKVQFYTEQGVALGTPFDAVVNKDGIWSFTPPQPLDNGIYKLKAIATDAANNSAEAITDKPFRLEPTLPDNLTVSVDKQVPTNVKKPEITGKTEAGTTVTVKLFKADGTEVASGTATVTGTTWSFKPTADIPDGVYNVVADATLNDRKGKSRTEELKIDTVAPKITIDDIKDTKNPQPEIKGKTEPGALVRVEVTSQPGGQKVQGLAKVDPEGNWTYTPDKPLPNGQYTVHAEAIDEAKNVGKADADKSFIIDPNLPDAIEVSVDPIAPTNNKTPELKGKTTEGTAVKVKVLDKDDKVLYEGNATVNGKTWSYQPTAAQALNLDGVYKVIAEATGPNNLKATSKTEQFTLDTVPPTIKIDPISDTNSKLPTVTGKTEPGATVKVQFLDKDGNPVGTAGDAVVDKDGKWSYTPTTELPRGEYKVKATATDAAKNTAFDQTQTAFKIDPDLPDKLAVSVDPIGATNVVSPDITGKTKIGTSVKVTIRNDKNVVVDEGIATVDGDKWAYKTKVPLAEGHYNVVAEATDNADTSKKATSNVEQFEIDTTAPLITINPVLNTSDVTPTFGGTTEKAAKVTVQILNLQNQVIETGEAKVDATGKWTYSTKNPLPEGEYNVKAIATDAANNRAEATTPTSFKIDPTLANDLIVTLNPVSDTNKPLEIEFSGKTKAGATVRIKLTGPNDQIIEEGDAVVRGTNWSYVPKTLTDGKYKVVAEATEGTEKVTSAPDEFVVDTIPPVVSIDPIVGKTDKTPLISGTTEPKATVTVKVIDTTTNKVVATGPASVDATGKWLYRPTEPLPLGKYKVEAEAQDGVGNKASAVPKDLDVEQVQKLTANDDFNTIVYSDAGTKAVSKSLDGISKVDASLVKANALNNNLKASVVSYTTGELQFNMPTGVSGDISFKATGFNGISTGAAIQTVSTIFKGIWWLFASGLRAIGIKVPLPEVFPTIYATLVDLESGKAIQTIVYGKQIPALITTIDLVGTGTFKNVPPGIYKIITHTSSPNGFIDQIPKIADVNILSYKALTIVDTKIYEHVEKNKIFGNVIKGGGTDKADVASTKIDLYEIEFVGKNGKPTGLKKVLPNGSTVIEGEYGILTIKSDGSYDYQLKPNVPKDFAGLKDEFIYKVKGTDGQTSSAKLKILLDKDDLAKTKELLKGDESRVLSASDDYAKINVADSVIRGNLTGKVGGLSAVLDATVLGIGGFSLANVSLVTPSKALYFNVDGGGTQQISLRCEGAGIDVTNILNTIPGVILGELGEVVFNVYDVGTRSILTQKTVKIGIDSILGFSINGGKEVVIDGIPPGNYQLLFSVQDNNPLTDLLSKLFKTSLFTNLAFKISDSKFYKNQTITGNVLKGTLDENGKLVGADEYNTKVLVVGAKQSSVETYTGLTGNSISVKGKYGNLTIYNNGDWNYELNRNATKVKDFDNFTYKIKDANNGETFANLKIAVNPVENLVASTATNDEFISQSNEVNTLVYNVLDKDSATGGNTDTKAGTGTDIWEGFQVAPRVDDDADANATAVRDYIDIKNLLITDKPLNQQTIKNFIQISHSTNEQDTIISIDRDGNAGPANKYQSTQILVLKNVHTTLDELLANNQIIF